MRVDYLRSKGTPDNQAESSDFKSSNNFIGGPHADDMIYADFTFESARGDPPHILVSIAWSDVQAMIEAFAKKGNAYAIQAQHAANLVSVIRELTWQSKP